MYNDNASEAPLYLVPNNDGIGKRLVRRPHPPPTTAPLPDDFDAITETRDSTTVYDDATNSALEIDYDDVTVAPIFTLPSTPIHAPMPTTPALVPTSPSRNVTSPPRQHRTGSPSHSLASFSPDVRGSRRGGDSHGAGKARSVAGGDRDRDRTGQRRSLGAGNALMPSSPLPAPLSFPSGKGPAKGRNDLVEKLVLEDGPERTISVWREHVKKVGEAGRGGGGGANAAGGDDGVAGTGGEGRSDLDSHVGRRRVSTDSRRRVDSLAQGSAMGSPSVKGKGHRSRESAEFTEVSRSILQSALPARSATPQVASNSTDAPSSQPTTPQKSQRRGPKKSTEYSASLSDGASTKVASGHEIETVLASCQPSLLHLLPILEELGLRRSEHMTALARMREQTRDREVKEEALKKGITVVEWAILIDKLQSL